MTSKGTEFASLERVQKLHQMGAEDPLRVAAPNGSRPVRTGVAGSLAGTILIAFALATGATAEPAPSLEAKGMTFVASREGDDAVIVHAERARFDTTANKAYLSVVDAAIPSRSGQLGFTMRCDSGVIDLDSNDFEATGNVTGQADSGEIFTTEWVRYDHAKGVLFTDSPVLITDEGTTIRGGGFHYTVADRRFQILGGARVVQAVKAEAAKVENAP